jgi:hypothetical protein
MQITSSFSLLSLLVLVGSITILTSNNTPNIYASTAGEESTNAVARKMNIVTDCLDLGGV